MEGGGKAKGKKKGRERKKKVILGEHSKWKLNLEKAPLEFFPSPRTEFSQISSQLLCSKYFLTLCKFQ